MNNFKIKLLSKLLVEKQQMSTVAAKKSLSRECPCADCCIS